MRRIAEYGVAKLGVPPKDMPPYFDRGWVETVPLTGGGVRLTDKGKEALKEAEALYTQRRSVRAAQPPAVETLEFGDRVEILRADGQWHRGRYRRWEHEAEGHLVRTQFGNEIVTADRLRPDTGKGKR